MRVSATRLAKTHLIINIGGCESLDFNFERADELNPQEMSRMALPKGLMENRAMLVFKSFCKTQYAISVAEHKWVAEVIRLVAGRCRLAVVNDEGGYYHTGGLDDARLAIESTRRAIEGNIRKLRR